ncbi:MAG: TIGR04282 family arsenosugar biosynthesis glycosyltransferase [Alcanivorax sp.]|nr:TIGR04282 family arsenosugar biosynthesis glycosyltransferase [Alcanivorax sp.]
MTDATAVILLSKGFEPGRAKTRLIPALGTEGALAVHQALVRRALETCSAGDWALRCHVAGDPAPLRACLPSGREATWLPQECGDLGWRMQSALASAHGAGYPRVLLVGSDCAALTPEDLQQGLAALTRSDFVLTPAEDGGYVLLGSAQPSAWFGAPVFSGARFGGCHALADSLACLTPRGSVAQLAARWDVDDLADVERARNEGLLNTGLVPERKRMNTADVLDHALVAELRDIMGAEFPMLVQAYLRDAGARLEELRALVAGGADAARDEALRRAAHTLKGSSSNLGAVRVAALCAALEAVMAGPDPAHSGGDANRLIAELEDATAEASDALAALV